MSINSPENTTNPLKFSSLNTSKAKPAIAFDKIDQKNYLATLKESIVIAKANVDKIRQDQSPATFTNTILALESASEDVDFVSGIFFNQLSAHTNEYLQGLAKEFAPILSEFASDVSLDQKIFNRVQEVYDNYFAEGKALKAPRNGQPALNNEKIKILEKYYIDFVRNGALLDETKKNKLRQIDIELSKLGPQFSENVLKATNEFQMLLADEKELDGLPQSARDAAAQAAKEKGLIGWLFTLHAPSYLPFMTYSTNRPAREKLWRAFGSRTFNDKFDNQPTLLKIVSLRHERAQLLGYKTHAHFTLERRMAETPEKVFAFLDQMKAPSVKKGKKDMAEVEDFAKSFGHTGPLMPWDFAFYSEKLKEKLFKFSSEDLRPYFKLENVIDGVFEHARRLYGLDFKKTSGEYPVYHPDVQVFEVYDQDDKSFVGLFYADFFPRESKTGGAWMTNYLEQGLFKGDIRRPHVAIVCNFTKPTATQPSLITHDEVLTLFHEFGHALHSLLSKVEHRTLAGTNVYWDFVELPSQVMENWAYEKESLDLFAQHYLTGEKIPQELAQKLKDSSNFMSGYMAVRQLTFGYMDMAWHSTDPAQIKDVPSFEEQHTRELRVLPKIEGTNSSCSFSHIFAGGYSAGYYSYKWAEVLDADTFELFSQKGLFDKSAAKSFKENILSKGGTDHPMELYKKFRGREPDPSALLRREGLI
jgi:peptidyl-dipeptidase Dcp